MRNAWGGRVSMVTLVGVMVLSGGLVLMTNSAQAAAPTTISNSNFSGTTSWDKNLSGDTRFTVLSAFGGAAVRDNNTGLVWEQALELTTHAWGNATWYCANKIVGGAGGWRLPAVVELKSVEDRTLPSPYINSVFNSNGILSANNWWFATTSGINADDAWIVDIGGRVNGNSKTNGQGLAWCVRGPMNADTY